MASLVIIFIIMMLDSYERLRNPSGGGLGPIWAISVSTLSIVNVIEYGIAAYNRF